MWVVGNADGKRNNPANLPNDNQILKFPKKAGKFVMAIGKSGQTGSNKTEVPQGATGLFYYGKTNELFVSDGYGNSRVMVYDADSGKFKRMWGARQQAARRGGPSPPLGPDADSVGRRVGSAATVAPPVHDVKVSNDGSACR